MSRQDAARLTVRVRRVYETPAAEDGRRVLVDRLWPRGLTKEAAHLDHWLRAIAPSTELRRWYGHDPGRWDEFDQRYRRELAAPERQAALDELIAWARQGPLTLLTASRAVERSDAAVLGQVLAEEDRRRRT